MQLPSDDNFLGVDLVVRGIHVVVVFDVDRDLDHSLQQDDEMRNLDWRTTLWAEEKKTCSADSLWGTT
jgi:hypothetical protein